jgi:hypothetical protein
MRKLKANEIECRVAQVGQTGCSLLLYKTARVDRAILDEMYTPCGWQNDFKVIDGKMYGGIGVRISNDNGNFEWVWKWDCGVESNTEAEKGQASDCFKRAGFKWGIGVELYSAPFIFVKQATVKDGVKYKLANKYVKFFVKDIGYSDIGEINKLVIIDDKNNVVYTLGNKDLSQNNDTDIIEGLKAVDNVTNLNAYKEKYKDKVTDVDTFKKVYFKKLAELNKGAKNG